MSGPLAGIRVVEFAGIGPGPFCAMLLSDMGADVVRIDRSHENAYPDPVTHRGRASIVLDLKIEAGRRVALEAMSVADVVIEGYRPGAMEAFGLGPDIVCARNPGLVYGRMTGWGQAGPLAHTAGHDINYIAITGVLDEIGNVDAPPVPPLNLVGDFGGGALYLAFGIASALFERNRSGLGQVIDAAIIDGSASMTAMFRGMAPGGFPIGRGTNVLGGAAPYYRCYRCSDGRYLAIGALEQPFWNQLLTAVGDDTLRRDPVDFAATHARLTEIFAGATRAMWLDRLAGYDACVAPVLSLAEAPSHPHNRARGVYQHIDGIDHPAPAPRLSRTPGTIQGPAPKHDEGGAARLGGWGVRV